MEKDDRGLIAVLKVLGEERAPSCHEKAARNIQTRSKRHKKEHQRLGPGHQVDEEDLGRIAVSKVPEIRAPSHPKVLAPKFEGP